MTPALNKQIGRKSKKISIAVSKKQLNFLKKKNISPTKLFDTELGKRMKLK